MISPHTKAHHKEATRNLEGGPRPKHLIDHLEKMVAEECFRAPIENMVLRQVDGEE